MTLSTESLLPCRIVHDFELSLLSIMKKMLSKEERKEQEEDTKRMAFIATRKNEMRVTQAWKH